MIKIDGIDYNVPIASLTRTADFLDKFAERTADGVLHRDLIGVYYNYEIEFGRAPSMAEYTLLYQKLTEPEEFHTITLPDEDGDLTFSGYVSGIRDELIRIRGSERYWMKLSCSVVAQSPSRT